MHRQIKDREIYKWNGVIKEEKQNKITTISVLWVIHQLALWTEQGNEQKENHDNTEERQRKY